jgi:hypothetical protein
MNLGWGMNGMGEQILRHVYQVRSRFQKDFTYLEIGVADGQTLAAVTVELGKLGRGWRSVGVDLPNGYSLNKDNIAQNCLGQHLALSIRTPIGTESVDPEWNKVTVYLDNSHTFVPSYWYAPVHLALIDACHCLDCAALDFLEIEKHIVVGGVVMFHDFGEDDVGQRQPWGHKDGDVRGACRELGLLDGKREQWIWIDTVRHTLPGTNDMGIFQKTA